MPRSRRPLLALALAGVFWGTTVPLTKLALTALEPGWLVVVRFTLAAGPLLWLGRRHLRAAVTAPVAWWGAFGYGVVLDLQNLGVDRTSVTHAAVLIGVTPALVAVTAWVQRQGSTRPSAWLGYAVALAGVVLVAADGGRSSVVGDALVLGSLVVGAAFTVAQPRLLADRDPVAVTAVQFVAAALVAVPLALLHDGLPAVTGAAPGLWAVIVLVPVGTVAPFVLFAWGQARTTAQMAGAFLNVEPVVGTAAGAIAFGDPFGLIQVVGATAVVLGIGLSTVGLPAAWRRAPAKALAVFGGFGPDCGGRGAVPVPVGPSGPVRASCG